MPVCFNCKERGLISYEVFSINLSRCIACVCGGLSRYDVCEFSMANLESVSR